MASDYITLDALEAAGWTVDGLSHATITLDADTGFRVDRWPNGQVWVHFGNGRVPVENVRTLSDLRTLCRLLIGSEA